MNLCMRILKMWGWSVDITVPDEPKCIICVAPHTSNRDFILGLLAYHAVGRKAGFLMKESWFFFPLKYLFKALGGIPVPKAKGSNLSQAIVEKFNAAEHLHIAVTPEGTRSRTTKWRRGFLYIATGAHVPVQLGLLDYRNKVVRIADQIIPSGDIEADMLTIKRYYAEHRDAARYPEKFALDEDAVQ